MYKPTVKQINSIIDITEKSCFKKKSGGPFGAIIFDKYGNIVAKACNSVISKNDPTAHAEIEVIRKACKKLKTYNLSDYIIYATGYPCPMCMAAIIWAGIKKVYYSATYSDAEKIGFRDDFIHNFIKNGCCDSEVLGVECIPSERIEEMYKKYSKSGRIY